jgi:hypothetical protein
MEATSLFVLPQPARARKAVSLRPTNHRPYPQNKEAGLQK